MDFPPALRELLHEPAFWARYTFAIEGGPGADRLGDLANEPADDFADGSEFEVVFDVGAGHRLLLAIDTSIDSYDLGLLAPGDTEPAELGWDDLAHWQPFALRWDELQLICRAIGAAEQGAPLALLCRFAAVFEDDNGEQAAAAVDAAYASLRPKGWTGYWPTGADWLSRADLRGQGVQWQQDEAGHRWAQQEPDQEKDFYSTRTAPQTEGSFPHAQLRALLNAAAALPGRP